MFILKRRSNYKEYLRIDDDSLEYEAGQFDKQRIEEIRNNSAEDSNEESIQQERLELVRNGDMSEEEAGTKDSEENLKKTETLKFSEEKLVTEVEDDVEDNVEDTEEKTIPKNKKINEKVNRKQDFKDAEEEKLDTKTANEITSKENAEINDNFRKKGKKLEETTSKEKIVQSTKEIKQDLQNNVAKVISASNSEQDVTKAEEITDGFRKKGKKIDTTKINTEKVVPKEDKNNLQKNPSQEEDTADDTEDVSGDKKMTDQFQNKKLDKMKISKEKEVLPKEEKYNSQEEGYADVSEDVKETAAHITKKMKKLEASKPLKEKLVHSKEVRTVQTLQKDVSEEKIKITARKSDKLEKRPKEIIQENVKKLKNAKQEKSEENKALKALKSIRPQKPEETIEDTENKQHVKQNIRKIIQKYRRKKLDDIHIEQVDHPKENIKKLILEDKLKEEREEIAKIQQQIADLIDSNPKITNKELIKTKLEETINKELVNAIKIDVTKKSDDTKKKTGNDVKYRPQDFKKAKDDKKFTKEFVISEEELVKYDLQALQESEEDFLTGEQGLIIEINAVKHSERHSGELDSQFEDEKMAFLQKFKRANEKLEDIMMIIDEIVDTIEITDEDYYDEESLG